MSPASHGYHAPGTDNTPQVVRQLYEITDAAAPLLPEEPGISRLLLIGRHLDARVLAASLREVGAFRVDGDGAST